MGATCSLLHATSSRKLHCLRPSVVYYDTPMGVRERIKQYIDETDGISYASVSKAAGLSDSAVHKYVTGQIHSMTYEKIERITKAMGASLRWVIFGDGHPDVENIWDRIPEWRRAQALKVLETFADDGTGTNG